MNNIPLENEPCPHCKRYKRRGIATDALIIRDDKILLILRGKDPGRGLWAIPGGHIDYDESAEEALVREVKEETNLDVTDSKFIGQYSSPDRSPVQTIALAFAVSADGEVKAGDDATDAQWFDLNELPKDIAFDHKDIISDYLKQDISH